jgi:polar amino acid transport system substrate-binding protein
MKYLNIFLIFLLLTLVLFTPQKSLTAQLEEIQNRGKLIVAVKDDLRPLGFVDTEGNLQGLEIDLAKKLAEELLGDSEAVEFLPVNNQERLDVVMDGKADLAIARVTATESRSRLVNFSPYYYLDGTGIITKNPLLNNLKDLENQTIAVLNKSTTIPVIRQAVPTAKLIGVDSYQEAYAILESGKAMAFAGDQTVLAGWIQEYPEYYLLKERLSGEPLAVVMPKGLQYVELRSKVNQAIAELKESGWLRERANYWGLP